MASAVRRAHWRPIASQAITASNDDLMIDWDLQSNSMWFPQDTGT